MAGFHIDRKRHTTDWRENPCNHRQIEADEPEGILIIHGIQKRAKQINSKSTAALRFTTSTTKSRKDEGMDRRKRRSVSKDNEGKTTKNRNETF